MLDAIEKLVTVVFLVFLMGLASDGLGTNPVQVLGKTWQAGEDYIRSGKFLTPSQPPMPSLPIESE